MKKKNIFIVAIIILITAGLGGYFIKNNNEKLDTSDWLVYESIELGYVFKYPNNSEIREREGVINIILPEKYTELRDPEYYDEDIVSIQFEGNSNDFGKTLDEIITRLSGRLKFIKQTKTNNGDTVLVYNRGQVFVIGEEKIYGIHLLRQDPIYLEKIFNDEQIKKLTENYINESEVLEKIYLSFDILN